MSPRMEKKKYISYMFLKFILIACILFNWILIKYIELCSNHIFYKYKILQFFSKYLHTVFETMAPFLKTLHIKPQNTHTTYNHTHLAKANTSLKIVLPLLKMVFLHSNSTHKHKIISHIHAKLHTDVKNVKHYSRVYFACSECSEEQECVISLAHTVH